MKNFKILLLILLSFSFGKTDSKTCRSVLDISPINEIKKEIFVLIDETTYFNDKIKQSIITSVNGSIEQNTLVSLYRFSQFSKNKYPEVIEKFIIEEAATEYEISNYKRSSIKKLEKCLEKQKEYVFNNLEKKLFSSFREKDKILQKSDLLASLQYISQNAITPSEAKNKIVLIASDMLENSTYTSFYKNGTLRTIDIDKEISIVKDQYLLGNYDQASIYIAGAGIVDVESDNTRDHKEIRILNQFWNEYFKLSNGKVKEISYAELMQSL